MAKHAIEPSRRAVFGQRLGITALAMAVIALGAVTIPGTEAAPTVRRYRSAAELPALKSATPKKQALARSLGDSSALVHGTRAVPSTKRYDAFGFHAMDLNNPPPATTAVSPDDGAILTTSTPTLAVNAVTDPEADTVSYRFKITTKSDAETGTIVADTAVLTTSFGVPAGALKDGVTYFWHVYAADASHLSGTAPGWVRSFRIDLRLGQRGTFPFDTVGPANVNLANGNLVLAASSASVGSLAGPIGVNFVYNSQTPAQPGLIGTYTADANGNHTVDSGEDPAVVRRDPEVTFDWGTGSPAPGLPATNIIGRWVGNVTVPDSGSYLFGATTSDGVKIRVNNTLVVDSWTTQSAGAPVYGTPISLTGGAPVSISIDWFKGATAGAVLKLYVKGSSGTPAETLVPAAWLSAESGALPRGWAMSASGGGGLTYVRAEVSDTKVVLVGPDGDTHVYTSTATGYTPPAGEDGILAQDNKARLLTLNASDGITYTFDAAGILQAATSSSSMPQSHQYTWATPSGSYLPRLTAITDPVSQRSVTLRYGGDGSCPTSPPSGFDSGAPTGMLCDVELWDGRVTKLWYVGGQLARIQNPGDAVTDFAYDGNGRVWKLRDPLASDMVAAGLRATDELTCVSVAGHDSSCTLIAYDSSGRVTSVTLGEPTAGAARPGHTITYTSATEVRVNVNGATNSNGWARKVSLDANGRQLTDTDATNLTTTYTWNAADQVTSVTDAAGLKSTTIFDWAGRATDSYGPAPTSWFDSYGFPLSAYAATTPHAMTAYDEGLKGLDAEYFNNPLLAGAPVGRALGTGDATGVLFGNWPVTPPLSGITSADWSARYTGEVTFPATGTYTLRPNPSGFARVFIDDLKVVDTATAATGTYSNTYAGSKHRIRVEFATTGGGTTTQSQTYSYTATVPTWTVPAGVTAVTVEAWGAQGADGGNSPSGNGGYAKGTVSVTPGSTIEVRVGSRAGWNGGGTGGGFAGGGASDVRVGGSALSNRVVVGAGGGGGGSNSPGGGGAGGADVGANGGPDMASTSSPGTGASQSGPGGGGPGSGFNGAPGGLGTGGNAGYGPGGNGGTSGGGGGGYYGGGSGGASSNGNYGSGGGGGSNYVSGASTVSTRGARTGDGQVILTWPLSRSIDLHWTPPGGSDERIPGTNLAPRYGLVTSSTDADGKKAKTEYDLPQFALATATVADPSGLALRSTVSYEPVGTGYLRPTGRQLPKGVTTATSITYYGPLETRANPCVSGSTAVSQAGFAKLNTAADPDGSGSQAAIVREAVYDGVGRQVAGRVVGDTGWDCIAYDDRGRVTTKIDRLGGTTTNDYSIPGLATTTAPDSAGTMRATVTKVDLLGRGLSYTDELGTISRPVYNAVGQVVAAYRKFSGSTDLQITSAAYDDAGRVTTLSDLLSGSSRSTTFAYDSAGRLSTQTRPNGVVTTLSYGADDGRLRSMVNTPSTTASSQTFSSTGSVSNWTVPAGVTAVTVEAWGAQGSDGGNSPSGNGGYAKGTVSVTPGSTIEVRVGSRAGWNGGGTGGGFAGGGASDVRVGGSALGNRVVVGAGGGGGGSNAPGGGGAGGADVGANGGADMIAVSAPGTGASQSGGGGGGSGPGFNGAPGGLGTGGNAGYGPGGNGGTSGGGGGGYYGGGSGGASSNGNYGSGGGGGSNYVSGASTVSTRGARTGDGQVTLSWYLGGLPAVHYQYSPAGRVLGEIAVGGPARDRSYSYDGAGRLVSTNDSGTTRRYAYDANTNRCGLAAACEDGWAYDNADRITKSPYAPSYTYDSHGNVVQIGQDQGPTSQTFSYTGGAQTWTVPTGVTSVAVDASGAEGGTGQSGGLGGKGGRVQTTLAVSAGEVLDVVVGGQGTEVGYVLSSGTRHAGGFNGGGAGGLSTDTYNGVTVTKFGATGGGSTDVKRHSDGTRLVVAGGGGGAGYLGAGNGGGGGSPGAAGGTSNWTATPGAPGATSSAPGAGGGGWVSGAAGVGAVGGQGADVATGGGNPGAGAGGGGGYYGGGGSGLAGSYGESGGAGGGSSYVVSGATGTFTTGHRAGSGTVTLTWVGPPTSAIGTISYDANDHATVVNDGTTTITETLTPSGRVLRRVVTTNTTSAVTEDTSYGYSDDGDSPAYSRPTAGGTVTTYLTGMGGLVDVGGTGTWSLHNKHGDVLGTVNTAGAYTAAPQADEFGVGTTPASRLGWLGQQQRSPVGGSLGLFRMGVRLYDPRLGRFLEVDPITGGSANDYDYCSGDPVNCLDLSGAAGYYFEYDLGFCYCSAANLWSMFKWDPSAFPFPIQGIGHHLGNDDEGKTAYVNSFGYSAPLRIDDVGRTSMSFTSLSGHPEGAGNHITFQIEELDNGHLQLNVSSDGPYRGPAALIGPLGRKFAEDRWGKFADNLSDMVATVDYEYLFSRLSVY